MSSHTERAVTETTARTAISRDPQLTKHAQSNREAIPTLPTVRPRMGQLQTARSGHFQDFHFAERLSLGPRKNFLSRGGGGGGGGSGGGQTNALVEALSQLSHFNQSCHGNRRTDIVGRVSALDFDPGACLSLEEPSGQLQRSCDTEYRWMLAEAPEVSHFGDLA